MVAVSLKNLTLHDKGEPAAALDVLAAAFELIDDDADLVEAVMIRTEALLATDDLPGAREALGELASSVIDDPELALDLAELALHAEDLAAAERWIETARRDAPASLEADALHLLGRVHEARDDRPKMIETWRKVRAIDATLPPGPVEVSDDEVERIASETLEELPENVRAHLERVPILIDDLPSEDLIADGLDPRLLGLFQGSPLPEGGGLAPTVTNILLFRKNLERSAMDVDHLAEEIRITVLHETAHYFGLDEDDLEAIGLD